MKTIRILLAAAGLFSSLMVTRGTAGPFASTNASVEISGGGRADFVPTPDSVTTSGYTDFSVAVRIDDNGVAQGHFVCTVPDVVTISGEVLTGVVNADGSVTVQGIEHGYDHYLQEVFGEIPFTATFRQGGPGEGGFDYRDESGLFGMGQFDTELVRQGMIQIQP